MAARETEEGRITGAASIVGSATVLSRVLGYLRDAVIAYVFGAGLHSDAFFVAFRISNLLRRLVGEGALTSSFIPIFTEEYHTRGADGSRDLVSSAFTLFFLILVVLAVVGILFSEVLVTALSPGFLSDPEKFTLTVSLTRVMFPYMVFIGLMAIAMGVLNSLRHFTAPALAPVFFNLSIIACVFIIAPALSQPVYSLAAGVLIGGVLQLGLQFPYLKRYGMLPSLSFRFRDPGIKKIFLLMGPAAFGVGVYQLNIVVTLWFASLLAEGSVSYLYYAGRLMELPMGVFGVAITTAMLPSLSESVTREDWDGFRRSLSFVLRSLNFLMIPATAGLFVLSYPVVDILFTRGEFGDEAARASAFALYFYSIGLVPVSVSRVLSSVFYSLKDTVTPVYVALGSFAFNVVMCILLVKPLEHGGLALATSLSGLVNMAALYIILRYRFGGFGGVGILVSGLKSSAASLAMGAVLYIILVNSAYGEMTEFIKPVFVTVSIVIGVLVYLAASKVLNVEELSILKDFLRRRKKV